jgi:transmembrane sensor
MTDEYAKYWELIIKEQIGTIDDQERLELNQWKNNHPDHFQELMEVYHSTAAGQTPEFNPELEWDELETMIKIGESTSNPIIKLFPWVARAAAAVLIVFGVIYLFDKSGETSGEMVLQNLVTTEASGQKQVTLPDGTLVWINRESELLYPENFTQNTREVYLKGEAFFEVTHNENKPFIVHAGISKSTVIGTSFNLRAYGKEDDIRLTVVSGKVAFTLADDREQVFVTPGNMALLQRDSKKIQNGENSDLNFLSWKTNELTFNDCAMRELLASLKRHYGINLEVENESTNNCHFTGDFRDTELDNTLQIITRAIGASYKISGDTYIILGEGCK